MRDRSRSGLSMASVGLFFAIERTVYSRDPLIRYDFDLRTGKSETGLRACTYAVEVRTDGDGVAHVWVETPGAGTQWRLLELRPVSEGRSSRLPDLKSR